MDDHADSALPPTVAAPIAAAPAAGTGITPGPDHVEEESAELIDDPISSRGFDLIPVVGLGGSAGSIPALRRFFAATAEHTGMAYVVVLHLAADRKSSLAALIQAATKMPVLQVVETAKIEVDHVYVIPPGHALVSVDDTLRLAALDNDPGRRVAVDHFFRTLADTHGANATAIVLSGADGDGAIGIKRIKERGGLTIAQDPDEAEFSSMPRAAIGTGMVDWVLAVADMPARLVRYRDIGHRLKLPAETGPQPARPLPAPADEREAALRAVLVFLRTSTGRDFTYYKRATILRRIGRRMRVNGTEDLQEYIGFLRTHPGEAQALMQDMLISVTNFFRDREAFEALRVQIPGLFEGRAADQPIRIWVAACATGEEAYSIAMLMAEHARTLDAPPPFQIFASDLDATAIRAGREAIYPDTIEADVSEDRLRRYFLKEPLGYRVRNELRETVLFAVHDLLADSPFSRIDLLSCRNLLIYLDPTAQKQFFSIAQFAIRPGGLLFLGTSETAEHAPGFAVLDKLRRLYVSKLVGRPALPPELRDGTLARSMDLHNRRGDMPPPMRALPPSVARSAQGAWPQTTPDRAGAASWRELHLKLLEMASPPSVLVTADFDIVHLSSNAGRYLAYAGGEPSSNLIAAVRPALITTLRSTLIQAAGGNTPVASGPVEFEADGVVEALDIRAIPAGDEFAPGMLLVVFESLPATPSEGASVAPVDAPDVRREVEELKWHVRDLSTRDGVANEELKASNEELQAMNEELRSATEELETSREELQSINEELLTVNQELKGKVDELARANSDLNNLMASTAVAAVFLTRDLQITRFTPQAVSIFNVIASDVGRPISDLASNLDYPLLRSDAESVLANLVPIEREVQAGARWYLARVLPYRTREDRIAGVVFTFLDISTRKRAEVALRDSEALFRAIVSQAAAGVCHTDLHGRITLINPRFAEISGYSLGELDGRDIAELTHPDDAALSAARYEQMLDDGQPYEIDKRIVRKDGRIAWIRSATTLLRDHAGAPQSVVSFALDVTERKEADEALRLSDERLRLVVENAVEYAILAMDPDRRIVSWYTGAERLLQYDASEAIGQMADIIFTPEDQAAGVPAREATTALREGRAADERWHMRKDGSRFWGSGVMMAMRDSAGRAIGLLKVFRDSTEQREVQQALEQSRVELVAALADKEKARLETEAASRAKDRFLATLSHELRTPLTPIVMAAHALDRMADLPPAIRGTLDVIRRNIRAEMFLIDDLLDLTRISSGKLEIAREAFDVHEAIRGALEVCEAEIRAKGQYIDLRLAAPLHRTVGDENRIRQVMWNLIKNAAKFTPIGGTITIATQSSGAFFEAVIADTGVGIDAEKLVTIFDAFMQGGENITREYGGLGLGLAIARAMIDAHGGTLRAESPGPGLGATFCVELPLVNA